MKNFEQTTHVHLMDTLMTVLMMFIYFASEKNDAERDGLFVSFMATI